MVLIHSVSLILYTQYNVDIAKSTLLDNVTARRLNFYIYSTDEQIYVDHIRYKSCVVAVAPLKTT